MRVRLVELLEHHKVNIDHPFIMEEEHETGAGSIVGTSRSFIIDLVSRKCLLHTLYIQKNICGVQIRISICWSTLRPLSHGICFNIPKCYFTQSDRGLKILIGCLATYERFSVTDAVVLSDC